MNHKQLETLEHSNQDDEIDLFELFTSLREQWKWLVGITLAGMLLSVIIALSTPKQYEVTGQIALPNAADVEVINVRGFGAQTMGSLFKKLHQNLTSNVELGNFISTGQWGEKLYPATADGKSDSEVAAKIGENFSVEQLLPLKEKGGSNAQAPTLLALKMWGENEQLAADFLNEYIDVSSARLMASIKEESQKRKSLEVERIQAEIEALRNNAKKVRLLSIQKQESANEERVKKLSQSIHLLKAKFDLDTESKLLGLREALAIAEVMKVKTPKTIESFAKSNSKLTSTDINITTKSREDLFLMGADYLNSRIKVIESRQNKESYIKEISVLKKQIEEAKNDVKLAALKARKNDDPYITELPALLGNLDKLQKLTFDFSGAKLYRLDKKASIDGIAEKPKRALIVAVGSVLAFFIAVFVALIMGAVKRRKEG